MEESKLTRRCDVCGTRFDSETATCTIDRRPLSGDDQSVADLGTYRLIERIGDGGMGAVYRAVHRKLDRTVAIKVLQRDLMSEPGIINRFFHEARAANTIRHPHIIEVYDFVETGQDLYFVMEFLRGEDLHDAIHRRDAPAMTAVRTVSILEQVASGLQAAHARQIVHRDIKPENIFLAEKGGLHDFVKLFDFGVAKLDRPDGRMTVEGAVLGTPEYMSPEQARGQPIDGRSDIYSLGCVAYEMLSRQHVFKGKTQIEVLTMQIHKAPVPLRQLVPGIPPQLEEAVMSALAKSPGDRPPNALAFAEAITRAIGRGVSDPLAFNGRRRVPTRQTPTTGMLLRASDNRSVVWRPLALGMMAVTFLTAAVLMSRRGQAHPPQGPEDPIATLPLAAAPALTPTTAPAGSEGAPAAAPPAGSTATITIASQPVGATVLDSEGRTLGVTPYRAQMPRGAEQRISLRKVGYRAVDRRFTPAGDGTIAVQLERDRGKPRQRVGSQAEAGQSPPPLDSPSGTIDPFSR